MANLKHLRARITTVKSTSKLTQAMKVVSAAKLKKAKAAVESNRPYSQEMQSLITYLLKQVPYKEQMPLIYGRENSSAVQPKNYLIIALGSEKGLCGSFNSALARNIKNKVAELSSNGINVKVECIGNKIFSILKYAISTHVELLYSSNILSSEELAFFTQNLVSRFLNQEFDVCLVFYNKFISTMTRSIEEKRFIPILDKSAEESTAEEATTFTCEPDPEDMIDNLMQNFLSASMLSMLYETTASEYGARMTAMDNATRNAGELIKKLVTLYNRTRQSVVTTELIEIISGAESIKNSN